MRSSSGFSLLETIVSVAVIGALTALALTVSKANEERAGTLSAYAMTSEIIESVQRNYGSSAGYPTGVAIAAAVAADPQVRRVPFNPSTGCFSPGAGLSLCLEVTDDGASIGSTTGRGSFWTLRLGSSVGGEPSSPCVAVAQAARTAMISAQVGALQPVDGSSQWLTGTQWDEWWRSRCSAPVNATFTMR